MATARRRGSRRGSTATEERPERSTSRRGSRRTSSDEETMTEESHEDEDDAPRGRRGSRRRGGSEEAPSRRRSSGGGEDSGPTRARGRRGWGSVEQNKEHTKSTGGNYVPKETVWKPDEEITLVKFVSDEPFVSYAQHWINSKPKGRAGWECISPLPYDDTDEGYEKYGEVGDCPLCDFLDESPRMQVMFNVIIFNEEKEDWEYRVLRAGVTLTDQLKALNDGRHGPLSKNYWEIMATGTKGSYSPNAQLVRDRDLPEDWDLDPLTEEDIERLTEDAFDETVISFPTLRQLEDLVDEMLG